MLQLSDFNEISFNIKSVKLFQRLCIKVVSHFFLISFCCHTSVVTMLNLNSPGGLKSSPSPSFPSHAIRILFACSRNTLCHATMHVYRHNEISFNSMIPLLWSFRRHWITCLYQLLPFVDYKFNMPCLAWNRPNKIRPEQQSTDWSVSGLSNIISWSIRSITKVKIISSPGNF